MWLPEGKGRSPEKGAAVSQLQPWFIHSSRWVATPGQDTATLIPGQHPKEVRKVLVKFPWSVNWFTEICRRLRGHSDGSSSKKSKGFLGRAIQEAPAWRFQYDKVIVLAIIPQRNSTSSIRKKWLTGLSRLRSPTVCCLKAGEPGV